MLTREALSSQGSLGDDARESKHGQAAVFQLVDFVFLQVGGFSSKLQRIKRIVACVSFQPQLLHRQ